MPVVKVTDLAYGLPGSAPALGDLLLQVVPLGEQLASARRQRLLDLVDHRRQHHRPRGGGLFGKTQNVGHVEAARRDIQPNPVLVNAKRLA